MLPIHNRIARLALSVAAESGFVLAGGYALVAHGVSQRPSADVDLFTNSLDASVFKATVIRVLAALTDDGLVAELARSSGTFAEVKVHDPITDTDAYFQMGADYREQPPVVLDIGPVLSLHDAAANKLCAMYSRGEARDFIDIHAVLVSGTFTRAQLLALADTREAVPLDRTILAQRCLEGSQLSEKKVAPYNVDDLEAIHQTFRTWRNELALTMQPLGLTPQHHTHDAGPPALATSRC